MSICLAVDDRQCAGRRSAAWPSSPDRPDGERTVRVDQPDDVALHLAGEHHPDHVHRLRGGDPQAAGELAPMPSRSSCALICGPPPCTTTGRSPA